MASSATLAPQGDRPDGSQPNDDVLTNVRNMYTYLIPDPEAEGGKRAVARDDLAKGYEYGRTAVHISESDENITKLETEVAMEIVGFVSSSEVSKMIEAKVPPLITISSSGIYSLSRQTWSLLKRPTTKPSSPSLP